MRVSTLLRKELPGYWSSEYEFEEEEKSVILFSSVRYGLSVNRVVKVVNPYLWQFYQLTKRQYIVKLGSVKEVQIYHATSASNVDSILKDNLDWRRTVRSKYGQGVNFSPDHLYANKYCNRMCGYNRALIVCKILIGSEINCIGTIPPEGCDTTTGNGKKVYVKYHDHEFYPEYVIYYTN